MRASLAALLLAGAAFTASGCMAGQPAGEAASSAPAVALAVPLPDAAVPLPPAVTRPAPPPLSPAQVEAEVARLRRALAREVPNAILPSADDRRWIDRARQGAAASGHAVDHPQLLVVVDRNPHVQAMRIVMARPDGPWEIVGGSRVSTGQAGRHDYYITPVGMFLHTEDILDYRAQGTFNENHIRGIGTKGMRVWDFGWQWATKGWRADREGGEIRLELHATDPEFLEQRIGRPASEGCIRVPSAMNRFLDRHGVLDADYERAAADDIRYRALLLPDRVPTPLAGDALVVVDSGAGG